MLRKVCSSLCFVFFFFQKQESSTSSARELQSEFCEAYSVCRHLRNINASGNNTRQGCKKKRKENQQIEQSNLCQRGVAHLPPLVRENRTTAMEINPASWSGQKWHLLLEAPVWHRCAVRDVCGKKRLSVIWTSNWNTCGWEQTTLAAAGATAR